MPKERLKKIIQMSPAFDKRAPEPSKNYGIHGVELRMVLKGKKGATQFVLYTNWQLPHVTQEMLDKPMQNRADIKARFLPLPADVGYHSIQPMYDSQDSRDNCPYLDGKPCYYDGSGLMAGDMFKILCEQGSDGVWTELERRYNEQFNGASND